MIIPKTVSSNGTLEISATVTNAGKMDGEEVSQLYLRDVVSTVTTPILVCCCAKLRASFVGTSTKATRTPPSSLCMLVIFDSWMHTVFCVSQALKDFQRTAIRAGTSEVVKFSVEVGNELKVLGRDYRWVVEPGEIKVYVGGSSASAQYFGSFDIK